MNKKVEVCKFGGSSVATPKNIANALSVICRHEGPLITVVSAMGGVTDRLLTSAIQASQGQLEECKLTCSHMQKRYTEAIEELCTDEAEAKKLRQYADESINEFESICKSLKVLNEHTPRILDAIVARGERFCAMLFCAALKDKGKKAIYVDGTELIALADQYDLLSPDMESCKKLALEKIIPLFENYEVIMVPGFIGKGPIGEVRTLGRGGSDYSATILARSIDAEKVTLYKEVDGLLTADPRFVKDARVVSELHYREATELAYYGAKVLHPRTIIPLIDKKIPLVVKSSFNPDFPGTFISCTAKESQYPVKALTAMQGQALIAVEGKGMIGVPGIAARTFSSMAQANISISFISQSSSEASICYVVPKEQAEQAIKTLKDEFHWELKHHLIEDLHAFKGLAIVAVVGLGMVGAPGIAARTFNAIAEKSVNIIAIAQGSSELNISFAIKENQVKEALVALHNEYRLDKLQALPYRNGRSIDLCLYGFGQIGQTLSKQIIQQKSYFEDMLQIQCKQIAIADRSGMWIEEAGLTTSELEEAIALKLSQQNLLSAQKDQIQCPMPKALEKLFDIPLHRGIFVDLTADESYEVLMEALDQNFHIVLANKKPMAVNQLQFDKLFERAKQRNLNIRYEATVGAGLPILDTIQKLSSAGDEIYSIQGCLSGTLGYIMTAIEDGSSFSEAVKSAYEQGYTEPDPREDLSGMDVARKALILARTLGYQLNIEDIELTPLFRPDLSHSEVKQFLVNLRQQDEEMQALHKKALSEKKTLRYLASINQGQIKVGIEAVEDHSPLGRLRGTNNQVTICSRRYKENPMIVTGPGAGAEVTAAGVLNDIVALALLDD